MSGHKQISSESNQVLRIPSRLDFLDSTRGIAAAIVVLHHAYESHPVWLDVVRFSPLRIFLTARAPVIFFFVLSGFVLSYGMWASKKTHRSTPRFLLRRVVRIYIPYAIAAVLALFCFTSLQTASIAELNTTFNAMWSKPLSPGDIFDHFALIGTDAANSLNVPAWSLVYELRISIFIPLICLAIAARPRITIAVAAILFVLNEIYLHHLGLEATPYGVSGLVPNLVVTLHFTICFIIGAYLARMCYLGRLTKLSVPVAFHRSLWIVVACLLMVNRDLAIYAGASTLLYLCLTSEPLQSGLKRPGLLWLGRVSFSLYLTHMIVIEAVVRATQGFLSPAVSLPLAVALSITVATLFYWLVELPSHNLAKSVDRLWRERAGGSLDMPPWLGAQVVPPAFTPTPEHSP